MHVAELAPWTPLGHKPGQSATTCKGAQAITGVGFKPDLIWAKSRSNAYDHLLVDVVRGGGFGLASNSTASETASGWVSSFNPDGFTYNVGGATPANANGATYVAWNWKESVSAGFDIVTYTGSLTTTGSVAINHNLGVAPKFVISKSRNPNGADNGNWNVQVPVMGADKFLFLNTTQALLDSVSTGGGSRPIPTSTQFYTTWNSGSNISGNNYVAYCFSEVAGYSKFGSYTGNGSTDGPFVFCGFRPRFIMTKRTDTSGFWWEMVDTAREPANPSDQTLYANVSDSEYTSSVYDKDLLSNGFKMRGTNGGHNASGGTYIFMAFAEHPFKNALAR
jgi:hypothetical protein